MARRKIGSGAVDGNNLSYDGPFADALVDHIT